MNKWHKIKLVWFLLFLPLGEAWSQENLFLETISPVAKELYSKFPDRVENSSLTVINVNPDISQTTSLHVASGAISIDFEIDELDFRDLNNYTWHGRSRDKNSSIMLVYYNSQVTGIIEYKFTTFSLRPLGGNLVALYQSFEIENGSDGRDYIKESNSVIYEGKGARVQDTGPVILRILLAQTESNVSFISTYYGYTDSILFWQYCISRCNQFNINSLVNHRLRLAVGVKIANPPSGDGFSTILTKFRGKTEGYADEIHKYRDMYSADVCVFLGGLPGQFGIPDPAGVAYTIGATNSEDAFCAANHTPSGGTLAHEIAHLHGCRHDPLNDPSTTPLAYAHCYQYVNPTGGGWRTILAYANGCPGCPLISNFSNPDVMRDGIPTGTAAVSNNARVLNETAATLASFKTAPTSMILDSTSSLIDEEFGEAVAINEILLKDGFVVADSSEFYGIVNADAGNDNYAPLRFATVEKVAPRIEEATGEFEIFPNPGFKNFNIKLGKSSSGEILVYDNGGKKLETIPFKDVDTMAVDLGNKERGAYIFKIAFKNGESISKTVVKQ